MKVILLVCGLAAVVVGTPGIDILDSLNFSSLTEKQVAIFKLLNHVTQPLSSKYQDLWDFGKNYNLDDHVNSYQKPDVVKRFINNYKLGFLPRGEIFTLHLARQMNEVIDSFHLLYYANDFTTFIKTACWMRLHLNEGMFVYALSVAVRHRDDCRDIILPPPYEIYPYFFVRADVIQKAYMFKMRNGLIDDELCKFYGITVNDKIYTIDENNDDTRVYLNEYDTLRYFTEDIDLNTYYYYFHIDYPFWMKDDNLYKLRIRRGELMFYMYQQILARYYLESMSHNIGAIKTFTWYKPIKVGYWPWIKYHTGVEFPVRYNNYVVVSDDNIDIARLIEDYEMIIREAVVKGFIVTPDGMKLDLHKPEDIETLGKMVYGKTDQYHGDLYRYLLILMKSLMGLNTFKADEYFVVPTTLDHYQTALRDPVFYQLQKRLIDTFLLFKRKLPSYTREELYFPGVKLNNVVVDKLFTYFDDYLMDMTNAVYLTEDELNNDKSNMTFFVRKQRLNHDPFKMTLDVISDKAVNSVIRVFLGPKEDQMGRVIDINRNRVNFVEIDSFVYKLNTGKNTIVRNSKDMHNMIPDRMMTRDLWSMLELNKTFEENLRNYQTGFPMRLLLPKGNVGGMNMMMYVIVTPYRPIDNSYLNDKKEMQSFRSTVLLDTMPLGFPLDRHIDISNFFTPNMKFVDVTIFHKNTSSDMNIRRNRYVLRNYKQSFLDDDNIMKKY